MRNRKGAVLARGHDPVMMAMPGHPDFVAVECLRCGATTGYAEDPREAWEHWRAGDVVAPGDVMGGGWWVTE